MCVCLDYGGGFRKKQKKEMTKEESKEDQECEGETESDVCVGPKAGAIPKLRRP